jgi:hypothetical protein
MYTYLTWDLSVFSVTAHHNRTCLCNVKGVPVCVENSCPAYNYTPNVKELTIDVISDRSMGTPARKRGDALILSGYA